MPSSEDSACHKFSTVKNDITAKNVNARKLAKPAKLCPCTLSDRRLKFVPH